MGSEKQSMASSVAAMAMDAAADGCISASSRAMEVDITGPSSASSQPNSHQRLIYLLLENPRKNNNLGAVLRAAAAFGLAGIVAVGYQQCATQGAHGADKHVGGILKAWPTHKQAAAYLRDECHCGVILGLMGGLAVIGTTTSERDAEEEDGDDRVDTIMTNDTIHPVHISTQQDNQKIDDETLVTVTLQKLSQQQQDYTQEHARLSYPIHHPGVAQILDAGLKDDGSEKSNKNSNNNNNNNNIALVISKDSHGLPLLLAQQCHAFVHVSHQGPVSGEVDEDEEKLDLPENNEENDKTTLLEHSSLLDLPSTLAITLHHLTECLGYQEGNMEGQKFHVPKHHHHHQDDKEDKDKTWREEIRQRREAARAAQRQEQQQEQDEQGYGGAAALLDMGLGDNGGDY